MWSSTIPVTGRCWSGLAPRACAIPISPSSKAIVRGPLRWCSATKPRASWKSSDRELRILKVGDHVVMVFAAGIACHVRKAVPRCASLALPPNIITASALPPAVLSPVGKAMEEVSATFDRFCLAAGIEALGEMMVKDAAERAAPFES